MDDMNVTLEHVARAVDWAEGQRARFDALKQAKGVDNIMTASQIGPVLDPDVKIKYDQDYWGVSEEWRVARHGEKVGCGTACCIWGGAYWLANKKTTRDEPGEEWCDQSDEHMTIAHLFGKAYGDCDEDMPEDTFYKQLFADIRAELP